MIWGQVTISATNPAQGTYTDCSNANTSCSGTPYYGATIKMAVTSIIGNTVTFTIKSCSGNNFSTTGTGYIYRDSYCGSTLLNSSTYSIGNSQISLSYTFTTTGNFTIYGITKTSGGAYYYTQPITVSVTAPLPSTPILSSPSDNSCASFSTPPTLYWNGSTNSSGYFIYINDITNGANNPINLIDGYSSGTSYTISSSLSNWKPNRQYAWYIKGTNSSGNSNPSSVWIFNTKPTEVQATNTTSAPTNGTVYPGGTVNLYTNNIDSGVTYSWTGPNGFSSSVKNPVLSNVQTNMSGTYTVTVTNSYGCSYSSSTYVTISQLPTLTVTYPNGGQSFVQGQTVSIQWNHTGITGNIQIEVTDTNNNALSSPYNPIGTSGTGVPITNNSWNWTIPASLPNGQYKIKIYNVPTPASYIDYSDTAFTVSGINSNCITWTDYQPNSTYLPADQNTAFQYLCSNSIIENLQLAADIDNPIKREELAKVAFRGLYKPNNNAVTFADYLPNPFIDLQTSAYKKEALALSYLEYSNGISAFNRSSTHFYPKNTIKRQHALKLLMETLNIAPAATGTAQTWGSGTFTDVSGTTNFEMYYYLVKAYQLGFISAETQFRPNDDITRRELFVWLYKMLNGNTYSVPSDSDYYTTGNITPFNFGRMLSINDGNFNNYTKTSFNLDGKMPLSFTHAYNSLLTELPDGYKGVEPLGKGWTHNYNVYIKEVNGGLDGTTPIEPRTIVYWGDGTMNSFKLVNGTYVAETSGLYSSLTKIGATYEYTTKNQVKYTFASQTNDYFTLVYVKDRNNNTTSLQWAFNTTTNKPFLQWVETPGGRRLNFSYISGTELISKVTETGLNREINFTYTNGNTDLSTFKDPRGNTTTYIYENVSDPKASHLLKQIQLPKGNIVNNTYNKRKLTSTALVGQYQANVAQTFNYNGSNSSNYNQSAITTIRDGQNITTTSQLNTLGNATSVVTPTSNVSIAYGNTSQPTKPTALTNSVTGLGGNITYDANGNVTQITKTAGSTTITEQFTYNSFNDVLTHKNGNGYTTTYNYNSTGNLISVSDAWGNTTQIIPNSDGTTQKITNPEGIYTSFTYNSYGNVTDISLMGSINSHVNYDNASRATSSTNPNGITTNIEYELNDMAKKVTVDASGLNNSVQYAYDGNDNLTVITNPMNGITQLTYNNQDQLSQYSFAGHNKNYTYNDDGTLKTFKDQNNVTFTNVYNSDGTLQTDGYSTYTYNADKMVATITRNNKTLTFGYDVLKRIAQVKYNDFTLNSTNGVKYTYDNNDNITSIEYPNGFKVGYEYDILDRLTRVYNFTSNSNFATYTYLNDGRLSQQNNGNGTKTIYSYDSYGRVNTISNQKSNGTVIYAQNYTMDNLGNHLSETTNEPFAPSAATINSITVPYTHDTANRMLTRDSDQYTYDGNGNQLTSTSVSNPIYTYDPKNNMLTCSFPNSTFEYDALENRRKRNSTLFVLDIVGGSNVLMETNTNGTPTAYYIHGLGLIARLDANQVNPYYYHYDYRGSTTAITDANQSVTHSYKYGPFGELWGSIDNGFTNSYRYVGKYGVQFEGNQLYFMRARYYNPMQGRFLGEDPVWNTNLFAYCGNNPINYVDPSGKIGLALSVALGGYNGNGGFLGKLNGIISQYKNVANEEYQNNISNISNLYDYLSAGTLKGDYKNFHFDKIMINSSVDDIILCLEKEINPKTGREWNKESKYSDLLVSLKNYEKANTDLQNLNLSKLSLSEKLDLTGYQKFAWYFGKQTAFDYLAYDFLQTIYLIDNWKLLAKINLRK